MSSLIYAVEDEENIRDIINVTLSSAGFKINTYEDYDKFSEALCAAIPDLILLDIMLPKKSGTEILKELKKDDKYSEIPIVFLTAKAGEIDKVIGLDLGADDYIVKPFGVLELISRVKAVLRRSNKNAAKEVLHYKDLVIDTASKTISKNNEEIKLTYKEYELFMYLFTNKGIVLSREKLLEQIWGYDFEGESRTIDTHIRSLRSKLNDNADEPNYILTMRGHGYKLLKG